MADEFRGLLAKGEPAHAFALADEHMADVIEREELAHIGLGVVGGVVLAGSAAGLIGAERSDMEVGDRLFSRIALGTGVAVGPGTLLGAFLIESPAERVARIWHGDPGFDRLQLQVGASEDRALFQVSGRF